MIQFRFQYLKLKFYNHVYTKAVDSCQVEVICKKNTIRIKSPNNLDQMNLKNKGNS